MSSRKSKTSQKSRKVKSKSRKSKASQKSRQSIKQSKRLEREIKLSKEMSKRMSKKTPMIASSHGISLLKRSKRNMSKGRPLASARDFLLATSILTAALSPYDPHPMAQKSKIAPDTQVHLDWHKGQFPDKQLTSKQYKKLMKRGKRLATIKEGGGITRKMRGGGNYTWKCPFCPVQLTFDYEKKGNLQKAIKFYDAHMKTAHKFTNDRLAEIHMEVNAMTEAAETLASIKSQDGIQKIHNLLNSKYLNPSDTATTTENQLLTQRKIRVKIPMKDRPPVWWNAFVIEELDAEFWVKWANLEIDGMPQYELIKQTDYEIEEGWSKTGGRKKRRTKKNRKKRTKRRRRKKRTKKSRKMRGGQRVLNWISVPNGLRELVEEDPDKIYKLVWRDRDDKNFGYDIRRKGRVTEDVKLTVTRDRNGETVFTTKSADPKSVDWMRLYVPTYRGRPPAYLEAGKGGDQYLVVPKNVTSEEYQESKQKRKIAYERQDDDEDDDMMEQITAQRAPQGLRYEHNKHDMWDD